MLKLLASLYWRVREIICLNDQNSVSCYTNVYAQIGTEYFLCVMNTAVSVAIVLYFHWDVLDFLLYLHVLPLYRIF